MTDAATVRFTLIQKVRGLLVAGVVAWLLSLATMYLSAHLFDTVERDLAGGQPRIADLDNAIGWTLMGAVYLGLPAAFVTVLVFGFPLMRHSEKTGAFSFRDAAIAGIIVGAIIGAIVAIGGVALQSAGPGNALKPLEWIKVAADFLATLVTGAITGLSARLAAGRPRASAQLTPAG
jgi:hypothetical protein